MPRETLTDTFCAKKKLPAGVARIEYFDINTPGLSLIIGAESRVFYFTYKRKGSGVRQRMKLGAYPDIPLSNEDESDGPLGARQRARAARTQLVDQVDPIDAQKREAATKRETTHHLVEEYLKWKVAGNRSVDETARRLRVNFSGRGADGELLPNRSKGCAVDVPLKDLRKREITVALRAVVERGAPIEANRVFEDIRAMVRWAYGADDQLLTTNICDCMQPPHQKSKTEEAVEEESRWLSDTDIATMWPALQGCNNMRIGTKRILMLMLLSMQRVSEVAGMRRSEISNDAKYGMIWTIPGERTKNGRVHVVPLTPQMLEIINAQIAQVEYIAKKHQKTVDHDWVFPAPGGYAAILNTGVAQALRDQKNTDEVTGLSTILGVEEFTSHALRHTGATHMSDEDSGFTEFDVSCVLNHVSVTKKSVTGKVYNHNKYNKKKRMVLEAWQAKLDVILAGDKVVPLRAA